MAVNANDRFTPASETFNPEPITGERHIVKFHEDRNAYGIQLYEIPQETSPSSVNVTGNFLYTEIPAGQTITSNDFVVDYEYDTGFVEMDASKDGELVSVGYNGLGTCANTRHINYIFIAEDLDLDNDSFTQRTIYANNLIATGTNTLKARTIIVNGDLYIEPGAVLNIEPAATTDDFDVPAATWLAGGTEAGGPGGAGGVDAGAGSSGTAGTDSDGGFGQGFANASPSGASGAGGAGGNGVQSLGAGGGAAAAAGIGFGNTGASGGGGGGGGSGTASPGFGEGGAGGAGGVAQPGGELCFLIVRGNFINRGTINCNGSNGANGSNGLANPKSGAGGGGGGGAGGSGAGSLVIWALGFSHDIGVINANGGDGGDGGDGGSSETGSPANSSGGNGGDGGPGGRIEIYARTSDFGTLTVDGGAGGAAGAAGTGALGGGSAGSAGGAGTVGTTVTTNVGTALKSIYGGKEGDVRAGILGKYMEGLHILGAGLFETSAAVGGGGGGTGFGGVNYVTNSDFENGISDWSGNGTGMSVAEETGADRLRGTRSLKIEADGTQTADVGYIVGSLDTFDRADRNTTVELLFDWEQLTGDSEDAYVVLYDTANSIPIFAGRLPSGSTRFKALVQTNSSTAYEIRIYTAVATAWSGVLDYVVVTPDVSAPGPVSLDWVDDPSPAGTWTTNAAYAFKYRREMGDMILQGRIDLSGAPSPSTQLGITIPDGLNADESRMPESGSDSALLGIAQLEGNAATQGNQAWLYHTRGSDTTQLLFGLFGTNSRTLTNNVTPTGPFVFGNTDWIRFEVRIPILEWANSVPRVTGPMPYVAVSNSDTSGSSDLVGFQQGSSLVPNIIGAGGTAEVIKRVELPRPYKYVRVVFLHDGSGSWMTSELFAPFDRDIYNGGATQQQRGIRLDRVSDTQYNVVFMAGYARWEAGTSIPWATEQTNGTEWMLEGSDNPWFGDIPTQSRSVTIAWENNGAGGPATAGSQRNYATDSVATMTLYDEGMYGFCTLGVDEFTLEPGVYRVTGSIPCNECNSFITWIYNEDAAADQIQGSNTRSFPGGNSSGWSFINGEIIIAVPTTFSLQYRCTTTRASDGLGVTSSLGITERYATLGIIKLV